jgi:hypothetical protein
MHSISTDGAIVHKRDIHLPMLNTPQVEVFDWDSDGTHDFIGSFITTTTQLLKGAQLIPVCLWNISCMPICMSVLSLACE